MPVLAEQSVTLEQVLTFVVSAGPWGSWVAIGYALLKQILVMGYTYREMKAERDLWRQIALTSTGMAEKLTELAKRKDGTA